MNKFQKIMLCFSLVFVGASTFTKTQEPKKNIVSTILVSHINNIFEAFLTTQDETVFFDSLQTIFIDSKMAHEKFIDLIMIIIKYDSISDLIRSLPQEEQDEFLSDVWFFVEEILIDDIHTQISIAHEELSTNLQQGTP